MQTQPDSDYFSRRAREEMAAADRAHDDRARQSHRDMAERYLEAARAGGALDSNDSAEIGCIIGPEFRIIQ